MIKIYEANEKLFNHNGLKILHPTKADIFIEDNGDYYIEYIDSNDVDFTIEVDKNICITLFEYSNNDEIIVNNKYILMQLTEDGYVNNISEFTGKGKSFRTLYRNIQTFKDVKTFLLKQCIASFLN